MDSREFYYEYCSLVSSVNEKYDKYAKNNNIVINNQFWLIYALNDGEKHTQLELSKHCSLPKSTVNTIIKDLEKNGYIKLEMGADKRERLISFTDKGKDYADKLLTDLFNREDKIFDENKETLTELIENLQKFNILLEKLEK